LIALGHDIGAADGILGARTRAAVAAFQKASGLAPDGRAGRRVLDALRRAAPQR
jgi:glucose-6-phosphate 1-epimerase